MATRRQVQKEPWKLITLPSGQRQWVRWEKERVGNAWLYDIIGKVNL